MTSTYVVMIGDTPTAAAPTLEAAQNRALTGQMAFASASDWDYRWDEYLEGSVWRLMQRRRNVAGKGRRFSWTTRAVHSVELVTEVAR